MTREVREILKVRLPEVVMLVGLYAGGTLLSQHMLTQFDHAERGAQMPMGIAFLLGLGTMSLLIIVQMQGWGFLRTMALAPARPQSPVELLRIGSPFFWRLFGFQLLYFFALQVVALAVAAVLMKFLPQVHGNKEMARWLKMTVFLAGYLVLLKPFAVMPSLVLAYGATLWEAFVGMRRVDFWQPQAPAVLGAIFGFFLAMGMATEIGAGEGPRLWVIRGIEGIIGGLLYLGLYTATIRYVTEGQEEAEYDLPETDEEDDESLEDENF